MIIKSFCSIKPFTSSLPASSERTPHMTSNLLSTFSEHTPHKTSVCSTCSILFGLCPMCGTTKSSCSVKHFASSLPAFSERRPVFCCRLLMVSAKPPNSDVMMKLLANSALQRLRVHVTLHGRKSASALVGSNLMCLVRLMSWRAGTQRKAALMYQAVHARSACALHEELTTALYNQHCYIVSQ